MKNKQQLSKEAQSIINYYEKLGYKFVNMENISKVYDSKKDIYKINFVEQND